MGKYKRLSADERWSMIEPVINNQGSIDSVAKNHGIHRSIVRDWVRKYRADGFAGLENGKGWKKYTKELKQQAVEDVVIHKCSKQEVVRKYRISSRSVLTGWIKSYNSNKQLETTSTGRVGTIMTKGRKTTLKERIKITEFTIARNKDYKTAMEKFEVSYPQLYSWVKKYVQEGQDGLQDRRGKNTEKEESQLSEIEKLKLENKKLKERNEFLEMQDDFGKKLKELEHRYGRFR